MRNIFLLILTMTTISVTGQNHLIGVKGGISWTEIRNSDPSNLMNSRVGFPVGLTYEYFFNENFLVGADILYNPRGFTFDTYTINNLGSLELKNKRDIKYHYNYVTVPLKIGFNYGEKVYLSANVGLTPSILINAEFIMPFFENATNILLFNPGVTDFTDEVNRFDFGGLLEVGLGYKFNKRYWLYSSLTYQQSFTKHPYPFFLVDGKIRHYGFIFDLGLKFSLTKK